MCVNGVYEYMCIQIDQYDVYKHEHMVSEYVCEYVHVMCRNMCTYDLYEYVYTDALMCMNMENCI